ncbi:hypothetical protein [Gottfriedia solisilvae]|uniref:Uncharacterized protein n=1 Tax=Gottfriedia solisilvae TaxID=1516104 RepID=A0A8J3AF46_9BACI|nr:hypothetical protein [Gottfriedia solisilvae]GGI13227.1 hypothetical protein GCM10007380_16860 [Gottfriedia solisilvae]
MKKSKSAKSEVNSHQNLDELLLEDLNTADDIPIEWLPKDEPITKTMSYKNSE